MAGLDRRGELSVSQEDAREIQQRSQQDTRLRNSSRLIRARDAYEARRALGSQTARVAPSNPTVTEAEGQGAATTPRPDSPLPAPRYRRIGPTENANELHVPQIRPVTERTRWSDPTLESRLASVGRIQNILNPEPAETPRPKSHMPTLRSQPEFYMTGVIAVDTTAEPLPENAECTICLEPLSDDVVKFHACGHMFHTVCVQSWFDQSAPRTGGKRGTCPNCRHELYEPDPQFRRSHAQRTLRAEPAHSHMPAPPRLTTGDVVDVMHPALPRTGVTPPTDAPRLAVSSERESRLAQFVADHRERVRAHDQQEQQAGNAQALALDREFVSVTRVPHVAPGSHLPGYAPHRIESSESPRGGTMERDYPTLPNAAYGSRQPISQNQMLEYQQMLNQQRQNASNNSRFQTLGRSAASIAMTDALRRPTTSAREPETGHRSSDVAEPDEDSDADDIPFPTFIPERPPTSTFQSNGLSDQPRESRADLAARAIAERRPLSEVPGLNTGFAAIPPLSPQEAARLVRIRELPGSGLDLATRTTDQLRDEQVMLLDRLRAVQTQIGRNLEASGERATNAAERREQIRAMAWNNPQTAHLDGGPAPGPQDNTAHRPPPIAIPRLADPSVTDLRSSREPPDPRAIGTGNSVWSTDSTIWSTDYPPPSDIRYILNRNPASNGSLGSPHYVYPSPPGFHRDVSRVHSPLFPFSPDGPRTATNSNMLHGRNFNDEQFTLPELPALTTRSDTVAAAQPASEGNQNAAAEDTRSAQHPRRVSSTVVRHMHDDSLPFRAASTDSTAFRQHPPGRPRPSSILQREQEAAASDTQRFRSREARSASPQEDDNSTDVPEASS